MNEITLLPCPFCGTHLVKHEQFSRRTQTMMHHPDTDPRCILTGERIHLSDREDDAERAAEWNTRVPPKIKPLEWEDYPNEGTLISGDTGFHYRLRAKTPWCAIFVLENMDNGQFVFRSGLNGEDSAPFTEREDALGAAQADHDNLVRAALE